MSSKLASDLQKGHVKEIENPAFPFLCSPLGFAPKHDGTLHRINHFSYPEDSSLNFYINKTSAALDCVRIKDLWTLILASGRNCTLIKRDIMNAFRNIPLAVHVQWLFGFCWEGKYYTECCLPFGLSTAPFIFNLFAEAVHWMLQSWLNWEFVARYLDDFIAVVRSQTATPEKLAFMAEDYIKLTDLLGLPRKDAKDEAGTTSRSLDTSLIQISW